MKLYKPQKIYIEKDAADYPLTQSILNKLPDVPREIIENTQAIIKSLEKQPDTIGEGKRYLLLKRDQGRSFKPFPEIDEYLVCDYFTLHLAEGCDLECSYCILQAYLTNPLLTIYVNIEEMLGNLQKTLDENPHKFFRIGTGQLADSLSLDHITEITKHLIPFFNRQTNAILELKTKSDNIENVLSLENEGKTIISWSLNSKKITSEEEHKCAGFNERLAAAEKVSSMDGYRVGFHLDPIVDYPDGEKDYQQTIDELFTRISDKKIAWLSLGCLRFMPELKSIMQNRFPKSQLALGEWITGMDGKMRYLKSRRIEIYQRTVEMIRRHTSEVPIYLCMETPEVWRRVFNQDFSKTSVCQMLDRAAKISSAQQEQPRL